MKGKEGGSRAIRFADCLGVLGSAQNSIQTNALEFAQQTPTQSAQLIAPPALLPFYFAVDRQFYYFRIFKAVVVNW
jgi:hypothetical protein